MLKVIVVVNPDSDPWRVLDVEFPDCPNSPVGYNNISNRARTTILKRCPIVQIVSNNTGATGIATPIRIDE